MSDRIVILSDLHLGKKPKRVSASLLRPIWRRGDHVVVNGDVAEIHHPKYCQRAIPELLKLQEWCDRDGVTLTLIAGNHDPTISKLHHLYLNDGQVLVMHGDAVHPDIAPWSRAAPIYREQYSLHVQSLPHEQRLQLERRLWAAIKAAEVQWDTVKNQVHWIDSFRAFYHPVAVLQILKYWREFPRRAVEFVRQFDPHVRFVVTGHTHRQGIWAIDGMTVINTGCFAFPGKPRAVLIENDVLSVVAIERTGEGWRLSQQEIARHTLYASRKPTGMAA
jgi:UDP-2,3-diacylglucosamine pyrophosphatase LpxH